MMLQALVAYAERKGLGDLDFESRRVDYELRIDGDGEFVGLIPLSPDSKTRRVLDGLPMGPSSKNSPGYPSFVVDNAQYVLCVPKKGAKPGNAEKCFDSYLALIRSAAEESGDEALLALLRFLERPEQRQRVDDELARLEDKKADGRGDRVLVPALDSDGARWMHERPAVRAWWKEREERRRSELAKGPLWRCLVTGEMAPIARTHPPLKGPPFASTGSKLVAYDKAPFSSQQLDQGQNAPVSEAAARKYVAALNSLLERDADKRRRSAIDLDSESVVVFWTREDTPAPSFLLDVMAPPARGSDAVAAATSVWRGHASSTFDPSPFYAVTLGANSARVVVRDWFETTADEVKAALDRWFEDLHIGSGEPVSLPLRELLAALEANPGARDSRGLPPDLAARLFRAALRGDPLPRSLLVTAIQRMRLAPRPRQNAQLVLRARVGVIKAVLRRQRPNPLEVSVALDESNTSPPYLLGRLFAALEKLQLVAAGKGRDLNATVRDRYYGAASSTPAAVFGRLLALSMHHASKAKDDGLGRHAERVKSEIIGLMSADAFPKTLSVEEQGLFAVGYYHQREAFFTKKDAAEKRSIEEQEGVS